MRLSSITRTPIHGLALAALLTATVLTWGCGSLGPSALNRDQIDYGYSIGDSWKNQLLANIVKVRYLDMPVFLDVGQIVSGYTFETQVDGTLGFLPGGDTQSLGAYGRFTDRPTITFTPKTGDDYLRSLLTPIDPRVLLSLVAAGYSPTLLFTWAVESINGVENFSGHRGEERSADPDFLEFVDLLVELRAGNAVGFEVRGDPETGHTLLLIFSDRNVDPEMASKRARIRDLLGLSADLSEFRVVYSPVALGEDVLAIETRSIVTMVEALSKFVEVPADKTTSATEGLPGVDGRPRPFTVHSSEQQPTDPFAAVRYRGDWYWIDHEDQLSKRVFTVMLFLTTITNEGGGAEAPVLTIPTG